MACHSRHNVRATQLVMRLQAVSDALIALIEGMDPELWTELPQPGVWSPSKDAEHVAEAAAYHQWIVQRTLGQNVLARPSIERKLMVARLPRPEVVDLLRQRTQASADLVRGFSTQQLDRPVRPPRARAQRLGEMIDAVLIGHYHTHYEAIAAKLRLLGGHA